MPLKQRQLAIVPKVAEDGWIPPSVILFTSIAECEKKAHGGQDWARRHMMAWEFGNASSDRGEKRMESIIRDNIIAWARYGEQHRMLYHSNIGDDGFLGVAWKAQGQALRILLNGATGRLDCGTLDGLILKIAETCGVDLEE